MPSQLFMDTQAVRAEQFRPNMTKILGRTVQKIQGVTTFEPHSKDCEIEPGEYIVEVAERTVLINGYIKPTWPVAIVLDEAGFQRRYRFVGEGSP